MKDLHTSRLRAVTLILHSYSSSSVAPPSPFPLKREHAGNRYSILISQRDLALGKIFLGSTYGRTSSPKSQPPSHSRNRLSNTNTRTRTSHLDLAILHQHNIAPTPHDSKDTSSQRRRSHCYSCGTQHSLLQL